MTFRLIFKYWLPAVVVFISVASQGLALPIPPLDLPMRSPKIPTLGGRFPTSFPYSPAMILIFPNEDSKTLTGKLKTNIDAYHRSGNQEEKVELGFRVVHLYLALSSYQRLLEEKTYDRDISYWNRAQRERLQPRFSNLASLQSLKRFQEFLSYSVLPKDEPIVKFSLAYVLHYLRPEQNLEKQFQPLTELGEHRLQSLAWIYMAEHAWNQGLFSNVEKYLHAMKTNDQGILSWAFYRQGCLFYKKGDFTNASKNFEKAHRLIRNKGYLKEFQQRIEWIWASSLSLQGDAAAVLEIQTQQDLGVSFLKLAEQLYSDRGDIGGAIHIAQHLSLDSSLSTERPIIVKRLALYHYHLRQWPALWNLLETFADRIENWQHRHPDHPFDIEEFSSLLLGYGNLAHKEAMTIGNSDSKIAAIQGYLLFINKFAKDDRLPLVKFYLADVYMRHGLFAPALLLLEELIQSPTQSRYEIFDINVGDKVPLGYPAALRLILASQGMLNDVQDLTVAKKNPVVESLAEACLIFIRAFPEATGPGTDCYLTIQSQLKKVGQAKKRREFMEAVALLSFKTKLGLEALETLLHHSQEHGKAHQERLNRLSHHQASKEASFKAILSRYGNGHD